jgi:hypothetical protein
MLAPTHLSLGGLGDTTVASGLALCDRLAELALNILKHLRGLDMKVGRHEAQSLGVPGLISVMFDDPLSP